METTTKNIVSNSHKFRVSELVTLMPARETDALIKQLPEYDHTMVTEILQNQASIAQTGNEIATQQLATMYLQKPKTPQLRMLYNGKIAKSSQLLKGATQLSDQNKKNLEYRKQNEYGPVPNSVQTSIGNGINFKQTVGTPTRAQTASKRSNEAGKRFKDPHQQVFSNAVLQQNGMNSNRSEMALMPGQQHVKNQMLKKIVHQQTGMTTVNFSDHLHGSNSKEKTANSTQNLYHSDVSKQNFIKYGQISGKSKLKLARQSFNRQNMTIASQIQHKQDIDSIDEIKDQYNIRVYGANQQKNKRGVYEQAGTIEEALRAPIIQIEEDGLTERYSLNKVGITSNPALLTPDLIQQTQDHHSITAISHGDERIQQQYQQACMLSAYQLAAEEIDRYSSQAHNTTNQTVFSQLRKDSKSEEIQQQLQEVNESKRHIKTKSNSPECDMVIKNDLKVEGSYQRSIEKRHLHSLKYPRSYLKKSESKWVHEDSPKLMPNKSNSLIKKDNNLLLNVGQVSGDVSAYQSGDLDYDQQALADVVTDQKDIKFTISGKARAAQNLQKEINTQKNILKRQQIVQAYDGTERTIRANLRRNESYHSLNSLNKLNEQLKQDSSTGTVEAELRFGMFKFNKKTKIKGSNKEQVNTKYYDGQSFDMRLRPKDITDTPDGKMIGVNPSRVIVSAFQTKKELDCQFRVRLDDKRINLNSNTVTFAQKFAKSQPTWRVRRQERKPGQMAPCTGFYDTDVGRPPVKGPNFDKAMSRDLFSNDKEKLNRDYEVRAEIQRNALKRKSLATYIHRGERYGGELKKAGHQHGAWLALETHADQVKAEQAERNREIQSKAIDQFNPKSLSDPATQVRLRRHVPSEMLLGTAADSIQIASEQIKIQTEEFVEKYSKKADY